VELALFYRVIGLVEVEVVLELLAETLLVQAELEV
jgi:hypothetical protein